MSSPGSKPTVSREDLAAAIEARRELGDELEPHVIDSFVERVGRRIDERLREQRPARRDGSAFVLALASLGMGIPLSGIALGFGEGAGLVALVLVWTAIVAVNVVYGRTR